MGRIYTTTTLADRFWENVDKGGPIPPHRPELGPCWVWTGGKSGRDQYGVVTMTGLDVPCPVKRPYAHRVAFLLAHGRWPMPDGLHHCDNPPCVKAISDELGPAHIWEGTNRDNVHDMIAKGRKTLFLGDLNGSRKHPERVARGVSHGAHTKPEKRCRGESHGMSKLTEADIISIRSAVGTDAAIAAMFAVGRSTIQKIRSGSIWRHLL